jgi:hypothetical protein
MRAAIDCCVQLHQWDHALQLADGCNSTEAEGLLQQYATHLLEKKKYLEAVELYRKVDCCFCCCHCRCCCCCCCCCSCSVCRCCRGSPLARPPPSDFLCCWHCLPSSSPRRQAQRHSEAAKLLVDTAVELAGRRGPPLQVKKLYVLAALETEAHTRKLLAAAAAGDGSGKAGGSSRAARHSKVAGGGATQMAGAAQTLAGELEVVALRAAQHAPRLQRVLHLYVPCD